MDDSLRGFFIRIINGDKREKVINETTLHEQLIKPDVVVGNIQNINECIVATNQVPIVVDGEIKGLLEHFKI